MIHCVPPLHTHLSLYNLFKDFSGHNTGYPVLDYHLFYAGQYGGLGPKFCFHKRSFLPSPLWNLQNLGSVPPYG